MKFAYKPSPNYRTKQTTSGIMSITSYKLTVFGDTEGVGDKAVTDDNLAKYSGATLESSIDATSGATYTSKSLAAMAQAALNAAAGK